MIQKVKTLPSPLPLPLLRRPLYYVCLLILIAGINVGINLGCSGSLQELASDITEARNVSNSGMNSPGDMDGDGISNVADNCPIKANADQADIDDDGDGDACDSQNDDDPDGDGKPDHMDHCPEVNDDKTTCLAFGQAANQDWDRDGTANSADTDDDNDRVSDTRDNCDYAINLNQKDRDGDGVGDACDDSDSDGILDDVDTCPRTANTCASKTTSHRVGSASASATAMNCNDEDSDHDGHDSDSPMHRQTGFNTNKGGDLCDNDDDNDGVTDASDNCRTISNRYQQDRDSDGKGDECDNDDDNDRIVDALDNCPNKANSDQADKDNDGIGDICDPVDNVRLANAAAFDRAVRTGQEFRAEPDQKKEISTGEAQKTGPDAEGNTYTCTVKKYAATAGYNEQFLLDPTSSVIYPGSVIRGETVDDGRYIPINFNRSPMNISVSILGAGTSTGRTVQNPTLSHVRNTINDIITNVGDIEPPANGQLTTHSVYSNMHFGLSFGIDVEATVNPSISVALGASFNASYNDTRQRYMTRFLHRYYDVTVDIPQNPSDFYEEFPNINGRMTPVYVSSMKYGRTLFFELISHQTEFEIEAALRAALKATKVSVSTELSAKYSRTFRESTVKVTTIGGAGSVGSSISTADDVRPYLAEGGRSYNDGLPLSYTLRFLKDNSVARVSLSSEYNIRECDLVPPNKDTLNLRVVKMRSSNNDERGNRGLELYGNIRFRTVNAPVGNSEECTIGYEPGYKRLIERPSYNYIWTPGSWVDVKTLGFSTTYKISKADMDANKNIEFCAELYDYDRHGGDEWYRGSVRLSQDEALGISTQESQAKVLRFQNAYDRWVDIQVIRTDSTP